MAADTPDKTRRFVVLPALNNFNARSSTESVKMSRTFAQIASRPKRRGELVDVPGLDTLPGGAIRIVERIDREASVVEISEAQRLALTALYPGLIVRPEVRLRMMRASPLRAHIQNARLPIRTVIKRLAISVVDGTGQPVKGVDIVVVFNLKRRTGVQDLTTDDRGSVETALPARLRTIELVTANALSGYWPAVVRDIDVSAQGTAVIALTLVSINPGHADALDLMLPAPRAGGTGAGVRIAVIDSGISGPPGARIVNGKNTTATEDEALCDDNGLGHGTHVAGIIARLAPDAEIYNYRVFEEGAEDAGEAAIARAINAAVGDNCDLINLSLGQDTEAISITRELRRARALGAVCVAAVGNDFGGAVAFPAWSDHVLGITAAGHSAGWPAATARDLDIAADPVAVGPVFFAAFSNYGQEVDYMMPGSGIISWVSPTGTGVMSGTSMAAPAATGMLARLLSNNAMLLNANTPRDQARSDAIVALAGATCTQVGFTSDYEGRGVIG
jgi:minor extracellular protease Epr